TGCHSGKPILRARNWLVATAWILAACGSGASPEDEIRALVGAAETAAEARDASSLRELIADDYRDGDGRSADELRRYLHGYLIAHQSIRLITRIDAIELQGAEVARAQVTVGMLGRESESTWDFAADIYHFDLRLAQEGGEWRVTRAGWQAER
ncbi:MAG: hypothetical protein OEW16_12995, partial [Gammaproteobacteria bacterium]|nr:hypothetical protein [Gammaproteobacteria bacterium]